MIYFSSPHLKFLGTCSVGSRIALLLDVRDELKNLEGGIVDM